MIWINIKDKLPPHGEAFDIDYVLSYHTIHGVGVSRFYVLHESITEEYEEDLDAFTSPA